MSMAVRRSSFRVLYALVAGVAVCGLLLPILFPRGAYAQELIDRSLALTSPTPGAKTLHTFTFTYATTSTPVGSVVFEYCTSPFAEEPCTAPTGLDASGTTLFQQSGETGFSITSLLSNQITLSRTPTLPTNNPSEYTFENVINPTGPPATFYVRISTYPTTDASGGSTDYGAVAAATTSSLLVSTQVPPILKFCVGLSITGDCSTASGNIVDVGQLSAADVSSGTSQMQAGTNAQFGLSIVVYGDTMTSGNNSISALSIPTASAPGNAQFGLNLRQNSDPPIGQDPSGSGVSNPTASYDTPDRYMFANGSTVATSPVATDIRTFTSSYIVNIPPSQAPGVYTATLTYICSATF